MQQVITELERLGKRSRVMLLVQRVSVILAWSQGVMIGLILFDFALRLPAGFRLVLLLGGLGAIGYFLWTYLRPAIEFRPSLTQLALRVERVMPALAGRLASSVEFAAAGVDQSNQMAARAVRETQTRLTGESVTGVMNSKQTWRDVAIMLAVLTVGCVLTVTSPAGAFTGLTRLFAPYSQTKWPARTGVESLTMMQVHPRGQSLMLRAGVTKGLQSQRVDAHYRVRIDGSFQPWQRIVLTHQTGGSIHERLIDTSAPGSEEVELYFTTDDDETATQRVQLVPPPAVRRATLTIEPPTYAAPFVAGTQLELGQGADSRAITETPSLIGSTATLRFELNKPLPAPQSLASAFGWSSAEAGEASFAIDPVNESVWTLQWTLTGTRVLSLNLVDEHGLRNVDSIAYRIEAVPDLPPAVTITLPQTDETVLPTAVVALQTEARDDVALSQLAIEAHVQTGGRSPDETMAQAAAWRQGDAAAEPIAIVASELDLASLHVSEGDTVLVSGVATDVFESIDAVAEESVTGQTVRSQLRRLRVISETDFATQLRRQLGAVRQNAIRIEAQQAELQDDIEEEGVAEASGMNRAQAQIAERIAQQRESVRDIERLVRQNRLDDSQLSEILQQSNDLLDAAGRAANRAVEAMEQQGREADDNAANGEDAPSDQPDEQPSDPLAPGSAGGTSTPREGGAQDSPQPSNQPGDAPQPDTEPREAGEQSDDQNAESSGAASEASEEDREVLEAQQEVREELTDLIQLLDRDEDTWVVRRQLDNLLREQQELEDATAQLGEQTIGRRPEDLTEQQRTELDRITQRQRDLRDEARKLIENLRNRAKAMESVDPQAAQGMRDSADTAEERQLDQDMENAAQRAQQNQMTSATAAQQSAQSTMQQMQQDIENTRRAQAQQLIRQLSSLIESIQRLVTVQENELIALGVANDAENHSGLDRGMIRLNQNTQAVAGEARAAGQEARRIGRSLDRAADAQGAAVVALRAQPVNAADAEASENRSLELLKEAKKLAEELQQETQEREMERRREELIGAYRAFAERQVAVREETLPLSGPPLTDRRQIMEARRLATAQDDIRTGLNQLRDSTSEILDSPVFVHVHRAMDTWSAAVSDMLVAGTVNVDATDRQQQIADSIGRLIKAMEDSMRPPGEFAEDQQQQGGDSQSAGQQGEQPLLPPITQLKLLREIQDQVYNTTKNLDSRTDLDSVQMRTRLREVGQQQRELLDLGKQLLEMLQQQQQQRQQQQEQNPDAVPVPPDEPTEPLTPDAVDEGVSS